VHFDGKSVHLGDHSLVNALHSEDCVLTDCTEDDGPYGVYLNVNWETCDCRAHPLITPGFVDCEDYRSEADAVAAFYAAEEALLRGDA
jgi:hypothetical protein